jgi:hypothetical protein
VGEIGSCRYVGVCNNGDAFGEVLGGCGHRLRPTQQLESGPEQLVGAVHSRVQDCRTEGRSEAGCGDRSQVQFSPRYFLVTVASHGRRVR